MTPNLTINLLRVLFVIFAVFMGSTVGSAIFDAPVGGAFGGMIFGLGIVLIDLLLKGFSLRLFSSVTFGLLFGLIAAKLLLSSNVLRNASDDVQWLSSLAVYATFGYLGMMLAMRSSRDEFSLLIPYVRFREAAVQDSPLLVDTSVIIDGRIPQLCATGFLGCSLIVPRLVLDELQRLADSAEPLKRERGRRGLDLLQDMQRNPALTVTVHEGAVEGNQPVDTKLVQLAQMLQARLLTTDSGLCKIAGLQNVTALNVHDLSRALSPALVPGSQVELTLVKEGRDPHQAVGYLGDGTMVVVNHARFRIGEAVIVTIGGTVQTSAGRIFFAELVR